MTGLLQVGRQGLNHDDLNGNTHSAIYNFNEPCHFCLISGCTIIKWQENINNTCSINLSSNPSSSSPLAPSVHDERSNSNRFNSLPPTFF